MQQLPLKAIGVLAWSLGCWTLLSSAAAAALGVRVARMNLIEPFSTGGLILVCWVVVSYGPLLAVPGLFLASALALLARSSRFGLLQTRRATGLLSSAAFAALFALVVDRYLCHGDLVPARAVAVALASALLMGTAVFAVGGLPKPLRYPSVVAGLLAIAALGAVEFRSFHHLGLEAERELGSRTGDGEISRPVTPRPHHPLIVLGLDGLAPDQVSRLISEGSLPTFAKVHQFGAHGQLKSLIPTYSPILWTTVATGKMPGKHGVFNCWSLPGVDAPIQTYPVHVGLTRVLETMGAAGLFRKNLLTSSLRRTKAIWNIASEAGLQVGVVNWWPSWPAEPVNGVMVSDRYWPAVKKHQVSATEADDIVYPPSLLSEVDHLVTRPSELSPEELRRFLPRAETSVGDRSSLGERERSIRAIVRESYARDRTFVRISTELLKRSEYDVFTVYLKGIDATSHAVGRYLYNKGSRSVPDELEDYAGLLDEYYRYTDEILADILAAAPSNVNVLICSDHGFAWLPDGSFDHRDAAPPGVLALYGPDASPAAPIEGAHLTDVTPTALHLLGLPVGRDMDGRVLERALQDGQIGGATVRYVATYDTRILKGRAVESAFDEEVREELRVLGYIE
jgi:hypothetical protein